MDLGDARISITDYVLHALFYILHVLHSFVFIAHA